MSEQQFVVFKLGKEQYGVNIKNVSSISEPMDIAPIPNTDDCIHGLINMRGNVIPIVNLKKRFGFADTTVETDSRILIYNRGDKAMGFQVDEASQVIRIENKDIESTPNILKSVDREFIEGIGKIGGKIIILLNLDKIACTISEIAL